LETDDGLLHVCHTLILETGVWFQISDYFPSSGLAKATMPKALFP